MGFDNSVTVLRSGPRVVDALIDPDVREWVLSATGQLYSPTPPPCPLSKLDVEAVEPLGGSLLHLLLRPSIKQLSFGGGVVPELSLERQADIERLLAYLSSCPAASQRLAKVRDLFGFTAVDYSPSKLHVLRGEPLKHRVSSDAPDYARFERILRSLTKSSMIRSDLFSGLMQGKALAGVDIFPGIPSREPVELRKILLDYAAELYRT